MMMMLLMLLMMMMMMMPLQHDILMVTLMVIVILMVRVDGVGDDVAAAAAAADGARLCTADDRPGHPLAGAHPDSTKETVQSLSCLPACHGPALAGESTPDMPTPHLRPC